MSNLQLSCNFFIIDDFYENPDEVRKTAISAEYIKQTSGKYVTKPYTNNICYTFFKLFFNYYDTNININNCEYIFQYDICQYIPKTIIKQNATWVAIIFLTPNLPNYLEFFEFTDTTINDYKILDYSNLCQKYNTDITRWKIRDRIKTVYNRLIIFNADNYYSFFNTFGNSIENSQIIQLFIF